MKAAFVIMSRAPIAGKTKTRLQSHLSPKECAELHKAFLKDIINKFSNIKKKYSQLDLYLSITPPESENLFKELLNEDFKIITQKGKDLGRKMYNSLLDAYQLSNSPVIITGSDLPSLPISIITESFAGLKERDLVIGPSLDGGYYLLGMKKPHAFLFEQQKWGNKSVLEKTLKAASKYDLKSHFLPEWYDVDTFNELLILREYLKMGDKSNNDYPIESKKIIDKLL
ncbi:TIGR04282 family arsenosugar biosynthesis glycosyltransferase [Halanaerobium sp. Z-7514]|uniref:TIGR04282 family arsenosugar biosynthesis glycosyltransferase n=1 Tax=Halanaerobium polyolivorans TaxID=2886943 RepID=A0AAW4WY70_9FIRM|nr:TIGR04282 family arsenosugar biosynthesis glycosyltransferase [Halanaerobium polyolivorans]MCC3144362.1 TIGR04282 family arsenosugar biosynthesis glycosyltransferase [Halanaerobium polyolivorans]